MQKVQIAQTDLLSQRYLVLLINFTNYFPFNNCSLIRFAVRLAIPSTFVPRNRFLLAGSNFQFRRPQNRKIHSRNCRNGSPVTCTTRWCHLRSLGAIQHSCNRDLCRERPLDHRSQCEDEWGVRRGRNSRYETPLFATRLIDRDFDTTIRRT